MKFQRRNLGEPDVIEGPKALLETTHKHNNKNNGNSGVDEVDVTAVKQLVPRPKDGLVREVKENVTLSREEKNERIETEDVHHLGDFSDEVSTPICYYVFFHFIYVPIFVNICIRAYTQITLNTWYILEATRAA